MPPTPRALLHRALDRARSAARLGPLALLTLAAVTACGGGGDGGTTTPPPAASISLSAASGSVTVNRGASASVTMLVARSNYTGAVSFTAAGLPAGVTATFDPASISGSTNAVQMNLTASAAAVAGVSTVTVTASGSGVSAASATVSVTVNAPSITLTAGAGTASIVQGQTTTIPVTITRSGGFADAVSVAASGLPTGVTAAPLTIAAGSTTGTVTLTAAANATAGTSAVTLTASGTGVTAQTATVNLTVTASSTPGISLAATPAAVSVQIGAIGTSTITLTRNGGFAGDVTLAVGGAPIGVTATVAPVGIAAGASTSTLSLNAGAGAAPGLYNITVTGSGTGVSNATTTVALTITAAPSIAITAAPTTVSLAAGGSATSVITLVRTNFTADVALAAGNLPTGVTAAFAPASLTGTTLTSTLTLTAAANASLVTQNITVSASGTGVLPATATIGTTVSAAQGYALSTTAATAQQGATGTSTITITRTGGYTGAVTLTAGTLPSGVTATISPNPSTANSATITFTAAANATTGTSNITISGAGAGLTGNVTTTVPLTVTASGGGGTGNVNLRFCDLASLPTFVAFRSGTTGAWTRATAGANNTYSFTITGVGGIVWVTLDAQSSPTTTVWFGSAADLATVATSQCSTSLTRKSHTGSFAGIGPTQTGSVSLGGSFAQGTLGGSTFSIQSVLDGNTDLLAFRGGFSMTGEVVPDRGVLRRNVNYAAGSAIPVIDFNGGESFAPATATLTVANAGAATQVVAGASLLTGSGANLGGFQFGAFGGASTTNTVYGLPAALTQASDLHIVSATASAFSGSTGGEQRSVTQFNRLLADRTLTLGPSLNFPTFTTISTAPYARVRAVGSWQAEYGEQIYAIFSQQSGGTARGWSVTANRSYFGGAGTYDLEMPDLSGLAGWSNTWGLVSGSPVQVAAFANSTFNGGTTSVEGLVSRSASRFGPYTP